MFLKELKARYDACDNDKNYKASFVLSLFMLIAAMFISVYAVEYATASASSPVTDLILSNVPVFDVDGIFVNGALGMVIFMSIVILWDPRRAPFTLKTISVFVIVRSLFIILTHVGAFPTHIIIDPHMDRYIQDIMGTNLFSSLFMGNDSFFSGHTGLPFLMAFLYYDKKALRYTFMGLSLIFGVVVLLAHLHYTIDVLSAFFISYGIYRMCRILFKKDLLREQIIEC